MGTYTRDVDLLYMLGGTGGVVSLLRRTEARLTEQDVRRLPPYDERAIPAHLPRL